MFTDCIVFFFCFVFSVLLCVSYHVDSKSLFIFEMNVQYDTVGAIFFTLEIICIIHLFMIFNLILVEYGFIYLFIWHVLCKFMISRTASDMNTRGILWNINAPFEVIGWNNNSESNWTVTLLDLFQGIEWVALQNAFACEVCGVLLNISHYLHCIAMLQSFQFPTKVCMHADPVL